MTPGIIYFLVNPAIPGLVKIGRTAGTVETRIQQLSSTSVPQPFQVLATFHVYDSEACEKKVHLALHDWRPNMNREFFKGSASDLLQSALPIISSYLHPPENSTIKPPAAPLVDEDDIYFMQCLLHDGYQRGELISTEALTEHHSKYAPLELEYKLLKLSDLGIVERKTRAGFSGWRLTPTGLKFMFESGNVMHDLIVEARPNRGKTTSDDD